VTNQRRAVSQMPQRGTGSRENIMRGLDPWSGISSNGIARTREIYRTFVWPPYVTLRWLSAAHNTLDQRRIAARNIASDITAKNFLMYILRRPKQKTKRARRLAGSLLVVPTYQWRSSNAQAQKGQSEPGQHWRFSVEIDWPRETR
jgi:hypothetical protein